MPSYKTPGVYVEEISLLPPSVAQVETAIPAFIGYTQSGPTLSPTRIKSLVEFQDIFGGPAKALPDFVVETSGGVTTVKMKDGANPPTAISIPNTPVYCLYYALRMYFANGGGPCYIVSAGAYKATPGVDFEELNAGLTVLRKEDEPTLILFPDIHNLTDATQYHNLYVNAMQQCADLQDRFTICDVRPAAPASTDPINDAAKTFRDNIGTGNLKYGAAYFPDLITSLGYEYRESEVVVNIDLGGGAADIQLNYTEIEIADAMAEAKEGIADPVAAQVAADAKAAELRAKSLFHQDNATYFAIRRLIDSINLILAPSSSIAGIYARTDSTRGVWKSPANVSLNSVRQPAVLIASADQENLNIHSTGKSINAIRFFTGKGVLVWGARTLAGNNNEWKYVSVRRFYNMVEESVKKATEAFVFEPNDANTWVKVRAMIENFLVLQWRAGALMGATPEEAFFVKVGLGTTMTSIDVLEGRMIVEIGMAVVRPAEFIILRFSHKMMEV
ncbi:phage tail sheath family protein [Flavilitoribacter nigricans]|uniref:Phage tail protein n=1 Tax=Flavilitoribacter nigricans (strain ATCC 23147 / DSM 23189 / NBRC 102662 / NCIMB 1420 / SS-2) TaxID=1122177 RepID=A0A2D0ND87_FLAN2|nr:phage tail sheath C-terminal domain-containing protein [Flavilitoribacter nigricans]PHN06368.1 phage tail protein [Flavilitoribacter nigricans DSM 23189 = NBRC 102662]